MNGDGYFDEDVAETYDQKHGGSDPALINETVDCILELSKGGGILEFAIGTGRIAILLAERSARVAGIEPSNAMVSKLREKERGTPIEVEIGDVTTRVAVISRL